MFPRSLTVLFALALATLAMLPADAQARKKTDVVVLANGDHITGEIQLLDRGILKLGTDGIGTISIEWDDVDSLKSVYQFRVEDSMGVKYFGTVFMTKKKVLHVVLETEDKRIPRNEVVAITPLEASFWQQLNGSFSFGFNYTKSSSLGQLTLDANVRRQTQYRYTEFDVSSIVTTQEDEDTQQRDDVSLTHRKLLGGYYFATSTLAFQRNDELGLQLRSSLAAGAGANLVQTNHNDFIASIGLSGNQEKAVGDTDDTYNLEAFVSVGYSVFRYDFPKTDFSGDVTVYPNLTSWGRIRSEVDITGRREIVSDFFVSLSFYDSYDSNPADVDAQTNDYGLVTSIGWTF